MVKGIRKITSTKGFVTFIWILGIVVVWEIGAFSVEETKRTPENVLPHIYQIVQYIFSFPRSI